MEENIKRQIYQLWLDKFTIQRKPNIDDFVNACGAGEINFLRLLRKIEDEFNPKSEISFSKCSGQPGWNLKYKTSKKSLCTIYPMPDYFIVLTVVGNHEKDEFENNLDNYSAQTIDLYNRSKFVCGGHWLMISVTDDEHIEDILSIIRLRLKP